MKVCLLSSMGIYPERSDGPAVNAYNLAKSWGNLGSDCRVVVGSRAPEDIKRSLGEAGITAYPFAKDWGGYKTHETAAEYLSGRLTPAKLALRIPGVTRKLRSIIDGINPDIIFYNLAPLDPLVLLPFIYRRRKKIQVVRTPVWLPLELAEFSTNKFNTAVGTYLYRKLLRQFTAVITQSVAMRNMIMENMGSALPCTVIPNGVDVSRFNNAPPEEHELIRLLFVGRLSREKGIEDLIRSLTLLPRNIISRIELLIVGGGTEEYSTFLQRLTLESNINHKVKFLGEVDWTRTPGIYKSADIFVLPSYREGFPQTLLEAMASRAAVIATNIGGVQDIIRDGVNGLLFESGDTGKLARCIEALVEDEAQRGRLSAESYKTARDFDWSAIARRYLELFQDLVGGVRRC